MGLASGGKQIQTAMTMANLKPFTVPPQISKEDEP
jgi:hypothetical protein